MNSNWKPFLAAIVLTLLGVYLFSAAGSFATAAPQEKDAKEVYLDKCSVCHGPDGAGKTAKGKKLKVKDVRSADVKKLPVTEMLNIVLKGKGDDMDGFEKELGADMSKKLVEYMLGLAKP